MKLFLKIPNLIMSDSQSKRQRARKAKKGELEQRKLKAYRRRQGLAPGQEEAELASYFRRFIAFLIDQFVYVFFFFFYLVFLTAIFGQEFAGSFGTISSILIFGFIYFVPSIKRHGQTFGCKKAKIVVIDVSGDKYLSFISSSARWFVSLGLPALVAWLATLFLPDPYSLPASAFAYIFMLGLTFAPILRTPDRQGIHDMFSRAIVIKELKKAKK